MHMYVCIHTYIPGTQGDEKSQDASYNHLCVKRQGLGFRV